MTLCPVCEKKKAVPAYKPFCSKRCADVDLARWLSDSYAISGENSDSSEDAPDLTPVRSFADRNSDY